MKMSTMPTGTPILSVPESVTLGPITTKRQQLGNQLYITAYQGGAILEFYGQNYLLLPLIPQVDSGDDGGS